ncbi:hypothetical protein [Bradyrhizobium zhanjiangense]|uniref:hypothetical protein n=1 Tax=Bradyrhizobium zhanjiangense TaxID=1325107 RepID=UPI0010088EE6|nr:hypothetical protein [Bradyrhizobium zhanjiangense]
MPTIFFNDLGAPRLRPEGVVSTKAHFRAGPVQMKLAAPMRALGFQTPGEGCRSIASLPPRYSEGNAEGRVLYLDHRFGRSHSLLNLASSALDRIDWRQRA